MRHWEIRLNFFLFKYWEVYKLMYEVLGIRLFVFAVLLPYRCPTVNRTGPQQQPFPVILQTEIHRWCSRSQSMFLRKLTLFGKIFSEIDFSGVFFSITISRTAPPGASCIMNVHELHEGPRSVIWQLETWSIDPSCPPSCPCYVHIYFWNKGKELSKTFQNNIRIA